MPSRSGSTRTKAAAAPSVAMAAWQSTAPSQPLSPATASPVGTSSHPHSPSRPRSHSQSVATKGSGVNGAAASIHSSSSSSSSHPAAGDVERLRSDLDKARRDIATLKATNRASQEALATTYASAAVSVSVLERNLVSPALRNAAVIAEQHRMILQLREGESELQAAVERMSQAEFAATEAAVEAVNSATAGERLRARRLATAAVGLGAVSRYVVLLALNYCWPLTVCPRLFALDCLPSTNTRGSLGGSCVPAWLTGGACTTVPLPGMSPSSLLLLLVLLLLSVGLPP